jgi:hypothetical protein
MRFSVVPIDPEALRRLATRLIGPAPGADEADLRRGISTAYYALFHLLIQKTITYVVSDAAFRPKVARALQHGAMRSVCDRYSRARRQVSGQYLVPQEGRFPQLIITPELHQVASSFIALLTARENADYDGGETVQHTEALALVQQADAAFQAWMIAQNDASGTTFLQELFCRSIRLER